MKIGFYSPYLDSFGGGERYVLTLASHWSQKHEVDVFWDTPNILEEAQSRLGIQLENVRTAENVFATKNIIKKSFTSRSYDLLFFLSDGSVPTSFAQYNILHFQVPFANVPVSKFKLDRYNRIVCNSLFTKNNLDIRLTTPRSVIYPPVDVKNIHKANKIRMILSVGRFSKAYSVKKFDILIDAFRRAHKANKFSGWRLVLAGAESSGDRDYVQKLKFKSKGLPIEFFPNCPLKKLTKLYSEATIYWHAAGFGETNPEHMEHFGITTVEAMAAGCIPIVYAGGGQTEIVEDGKNGYLWETPDELIEKTLRVTQQRKSLSSLRTEAQKKSHDFSQRRFCQLFDLLLADIIRN